MLLELARIGTAINLIKPFLINLTTTDMSLIRFKRASWVAVMAMLALPGAMITSCSKENPTENVVPKGDKLTISVLGINDGNQDSGSKAKASTAKSSSTQADYDFYQFADADMAVSLGNTLPAKKAKHTISSRTHGGVANSGMKAAEEMESGMKYVVYIYDGTTLAGAAELEAGTPGTIDGLDMTAEYTWVAVSYNSDATAPGLAPNGGAIELPENTDVLFASGTVDLAENPSIDILFDHAFARIGVELNTIGVFGDVTGTPSVTVAGSSVATGTIDLLTGDITAGEATALELDWGDFDRVDAEHDDAWIAYFYTAATDVQNLEVSVRNLGVVHVDGGLERTYFTDAQVTPFRATISPELGKSHYVQMNLLESPLTTNYGGNEVKWARSNLFYRGDNGGDRNYAFYSSNELTSRGDGYFGFGAIVPGGFATTSNQGDPCALVYPAGVWRQPTKSDFSGLVRGDIELDELTGVLGPLGEVVDATGVTGLLNLITNLLGNTVAVLVNRAAPNSSLGSDPYEYGEYEISAGAPANGGSNAFGDANSASNNLRFYYNGEVSSLTVLQAVGEGGGLLNVGLNELSADLVGVNLLNTNIPLLDSYGRSTALWTSEQGTDILGLAGAGTWGYYGNAGRGMTLIPLSLGTRFHMANNTGELLNGVSALGIDVLSTTMKNVRCVRVN